MAAKDSISANESTDYSTFANDLMLELHGVKSFADATRALLCEHAGYDSDKELIGAHFLWKRSWRRLMGS
jgi:hypothetical protein